MSATTNAFDAIAGLPLHPLVVHAAVALFPLALLGLLAIIASARARHHLGWVVMALLLVGAATVPLAKESGEALAHHVGEPKEHAQYADQLLVVAFATTVAAVAWWVLERFRIVRSRKLTRVVGLITCLLAVASLVLTVLVGHSGAVATWQQEVSGWSVSAAETAPGATPAAPAPAASRSTHASASSTPTAPPATYTLAQVKAHDTTASCWAVVDGKVYDLTTWIARHPGGRDAIRGICGTDATSTFTRQHGDEKEPSSQLLSFAIGTLTS